MPRSLSTADVTEQPLETFLLLQLSDGAALCKCQKLSAEEAFGDISSRNPAASKAPLLCHGGEWWSRKSDFQQPQSQGTTRKMRVSRFLRLAAGLSPILVAMVTHSTPPPASLHQTRGMLLGEAHAVLFHPWVIPLWQRRNLKGKMKPSHSGCMRLRRSACTFIAMNIVCFDLIQLSCLPTGKGLMCSSRENKTTGRRKQKEKLANDQHIFTEIQSFM